MTSFRYINRQKYFLAIKATFMTFTIVMAVFTIIGLPKNEHPDLLLFVNVLVGASIVFPIFIIRLAYMDGLSKRRIRNKAYN